MKLVTDHSLAAGNVRVPCISCGALTVLAHCVRDLDGPAFQAYYCRDCTPAGRIEPCRIDGCRRGH